MPRTDLALLMTRLTLGGLMAGHGAQKLFGWFGGHGMTGTAGWVESMGLRPGGAWAGAAGLSELGGGALTLLGLTNPLGPVGIAASMVMAALTVHGDKPIWVTEGGAELPLTNLTLAAALAVAGPGRFSLDGALGLRLPRPLALLSLLAALGAVAYGLVRHEQHTAQQPAPAPADEAAAAI